MILIALDHPSILTNNHIPHRLESPRWKQLLLEDLQSLKQVTKHTKKQCHFCGSLCSAGRFVIISILFMTVDIFVSLFLYAATIYYYILSICMFFPSPLFMFSPFSLFSSHRTGFVLSISVRLQLISVQRASAKLEQAKLRNEPGITSPVSSVSAALASHRQLLTEHEIMLYMKEATSWTQPVLVVKTGY